VCVFTAPLFSAFQSLAAYGFVNEIRGPGAGLLAALFSGIVPSYISRSVAGSFDNEGVAIFALIFVFYLFVKARCRIGLALRALRAPSACHALCAACCGCPWPALTLSTARRR